MMINENDLRKLIRHKIINEKKLQFTFNRNFNIFDAMFQWANNILGTGEVAGKRGGTKTVATLSPDDINVAKIYAERIASMDDQGNVDKDTVLLLPNLGRKAQKVNANTSNTKAAFNHDFEEMEKRYIEMNKLQLSNATVDSLLPSLKLILGNVRIPMNKANVETILNYYESSGSITSDEREQGILPPDVDNFLRDLRKAVRYQLKERLQGTTFDPGVIADLQAMLKDGYVDQSQIDDITKFADRIS